MEGAIDDSYFATHKDQEIWFGTRPQTDFPRTQIPSPKILSFSEFSHH